MAESNAGRSGRREQPDSDQAVVAALAEAGFTGPKYLLAAMMLARTVDEMTVRVREGSIFRDCARVGRRLPRPEVLIRATSSWETARKLASATVVAALPSFRTSALVDGGWQPAGGASLKGYFIGACVLAFPNVYRKWRKEFLRRKQEDRYGLVPDESILHDAVCDPADSVLFVAFFQDLIRNLPSNTGLALERIVFDRAPLCEAAEEYGLTANALQKQLRKLGKSPQGRRLKWESQ